jgi:hypothetical protein
LADLGGFSLLKNKYNESVSLLLTTVYPNYDWLPWKFSIIPSNCWDDMKNHCTFIHWAEKELKIKEMSDWYKVTQKVR